MRKALALGALLAACVVAGVDAVNPFFNDLPLLFLPFVVLSYAVRERAASIAAAVGGLVWALSGLDPRGPVAAEVVVMGVDGATFDVLDAHEADLPAFAALGRDGARAELTSMEPMFSPLLWTTIASGRTPEEHGIVGFRVQSSDCRVARFWDVAENAGWRIGLYKWLVDYPPRAVQGFWVPSWLAPAPHAWPPELSVVKEVELSRRMRRKKVETTRSTPELAWGLVRAGVRLSTLLRAAAWSVEERVLHPAPDRANVAMQLVRGRIDRDVFIAQLRRERPRLATFTYYATDGLAHLYWDRHAAGEDHLLAAYRQADEILAEIRGQLGPEARLIVVSDHGFRAMDGSGLAGQFAPLTERLRERMTAEVGPVDVSRLGRKLTVGLSDEGQRERALAFLAGLLDAQGRAFYRVDPGLTLGLTLADEAVTTERLATDTVGGDPIARYVELTDAYTGTHDARGVFFAVGPGVAPGLRLPALGLLDVAPTVLAAAGLPASQEMPGKAVLFREVPRVASWDALVTILEWIDGEAGVDEERLRQIGYIE